MDNSEQPSQWYYKIVYFFVTNQVLFKRLAILLLILINLVVWGIAGINFVNQLANNNAYNQMIKDLTTNYPNWENYHGEYAAQPLEELSVEKIKTTKDTYDLLAQVHNPNLDWQIDSLTYYFLVDGSLTEKQTTFILPGETKYLFHFSYPANLAVEQLSLKIENINWRRTKKSSVLADLIDNILIKNENFKQLKNFSLVEFEVENNTLSSFWQTGWQIVLYQGQRPVAVNYVTSQSFLAGEKRKLSAAWSENIPAPSTIEIHPDINFLDQANFITQPDLPPVNLIRGAKDEQ